MAFDLSPSILEVFQDFGFRTVYGVDEGFRCGSVNSFATYGRLYIDRFFDEGHVLYVDSDVLFQELPVLDSHFLSGCVAKIKYEPVQFYEEHEELLDFLISRDSFVPVKRMFNAGVMYISIKEWISRDIGRVTFELLREFSSSMTYSDQSALNLSMWNCVGTLDPQSHSFTINLGQAVCEYSNPQIIHFTESFKPWQSECCRMSASWNFWFDSFRDLISQESWDFRYRIQEYPPPGARKLYSKIISEGA